MTKVILQLIRVQRATGLISQDAADWWIMKIRELDASAPPDETEHARAA